MNCAPIMQRTELTFSRFALHCVLVLAVRVLRCSSPAGCAASIGGFRLAIGFGRSPAGCAVQQRRGMHVRGTQLPGRVPAEILSEDIYRDGCVLPGLMRTRIWAGRYPAARWMRSAQSLAERNLRLKVRAVHPTANAPERVSGTPAIARGR